MRFGRLGRNRQWYHYAAALAIGCLSLVACGSDDAAEIRTDERVMPADGLKTAMDRAPLDRLPGSSFTGDDHAIWYTDFERFARYSIIDGEWATFPLPDQVSPLVFVADGSGGITALFADCNSDCWEASEPPTHGAWRIDIDGDVTNIDFASQPEVPAEAAGLIDIVPGTGKGRPAEFVIRAGEFSQHVSIGKEAATTTPMTGNNLSLCAIDGGYLALHTTAVEPPTSTYTWTGDETWEELRHAIDASVRSHLTIGPGPSMLSTVEVPAEVGDLLDSGAFVDACLPDGIAIIGSDAAHEMDVSTGAWTPVASGVGDDPANPVILGRQHLTGIAYGPEPDEVWLAGTAITVHRDESGWKRTQVNSGFVVTHGEMFSFPEEIR